MVIVEFMIHIASEIGRIQIRRAAEHVSMLNSSGLGIYPADSLFQCAIIVFAELDHFEVCRVHHAIFSCAIGECR
jgi:hypothetical protein